MNLFRRAIEETYLRVFGRRSLRKANDFLLYLAARGRGYNNFRNHHESGENYFLHQVLKPLNPMVCMDIGANIGLYTRALLESTQSVVYSFEPLPRPFESLKQLKLEFGARLILVNKGVGAKDEVLDLHYSDDATSHASFSEEVKNVSYVRNEKSERMEVITLDTFSENHQLDRIDFLKIDTEGFEYEVLMGALRTLERLKPKLIQIEYNWHQLFKAQSLFSFSLILKGYSPYQLLPDRLEKRDPRDPFSNIFHFSNFVFVRNDLQSEIAG